MTGNEHIVIFLALVLVLALFLLLLRSRLRCQRQEARRRAVVGRMLELAQGQNEIFDINVLHGATHRSLAGLLQRTGNGRLVFDVFRYAGQGLKGMAAEVYFHATLPEGSTFYKFRTTILDVESGKQKSRLTIAAPLDLDFGQKRTFIRVQPPAESIRVLALWKLSPSQPLPAATTAIGRPFVYAKRDRENVPPPRLRLEDISGTGLALRFPMPDPEAMPVDLDKGSRILCLVIFEAGRQDCAITFWCSCDVVHTRAVTMDDPAFIVGAKFSAWTILEPGKTKLNWFHCFPTHGVLPITQWVMYLDMVRRKLL